MTPRDYLEVVVKPNMKDFIEDISDARRAYNAIATADALAAHLYYWCKNNKPDEIFGCKDDSVYRQWLKKKYANLEIMHDVAKALKHVELTSNSKVKTAADAKARPFGFGEGGYGVGPYGGGSQLSVIVDGEKVQLQWSVQTAVEFYEREMDRLGI